MDRTWTVEIEGKKHLVEISYPVAMSVSESAVTTPPQDGKLVVDGNEVDTFKPVSVGGLVELPKEISFQIGGKPAVLRKKGFFNAKMELFVEGQLIKAAK